MADRDRRVGFAGRRRKPPQRASAVVVSTKRCGSDVGRRGEVAVAGLVAWCCTRASRAGAFAFVGMPLSARTCGAEGCTAATRSDATVQALRQPVMLSARLLAGVDPVLADLEPRHGELARRIRPRSGEEHRSGLQVV